MSCSLLPTHYSLHTYFPEGMHAWKMKGLDRSNCLSLPWGQVLRPDRELRDSWEGAELMHSFRDGESTCTRKSPARRCPYHRKKLFLCEHTCQNLRGNFRHCSAFNRSGLSAGAGSALHMSASSACSFMLPSLWC